MEKDALIQPGERLDSLQFGDLCILQKLDAFRFGTDSVLLADFPTVRRGDYIVDLGTGSGIITILMASRHQDCRFAALEIQPEMADMAARSNPPYGKAGGALLSQTDAQRIARHESDCTVDDLAAAAFDLLKTGGRLAVVFPAARAFELMYAMRTHRLEPKRIRTIHATPSRAPKLVMIEAVKGGGSMLHWLEPLVLNGDDGRPTAEWKRIYRVPENS